MYNLAIVIVSWNICDMLAACLRSVQTDLANSTLSSQIWVVDNASTDDSVAMIQRNFPDVQLITSQKNLGFAKGNNTALQAIGFNNKQSSQLPEAVLLLNPDTEVHAGALQTLFYFLQTQPKAGIVGAQLCYGDGSFQHGAFALPGLSQLITELLPVPGRLTESTFNGRYPRSSYKAGQPFSIGHPLGAAMAVKREAIEQVGLLDEQYHMYVEEVDWSKRITAAGWQAFCVPTAMITHFGGQSTAQIKTTSFINLWISRHRFYRTYYSSLKFWLAQRIVIMGMNRKAKQDQTMAGQGQLTTTELTERLETYKRVATIWQEK